MTVAELIELLKTQPQDRQVVVADTHLKIAIKLSTLAYRDRKDRVEIYMEYTDDNESPFGFGELESLIDQFRDNY